MARIACNNVLLQYSNNLSAYHRPQQKISDV